MSAVPTTKSGMILKLGGGNLRKVYQKRFFLLRGLQLYWFKRKGDVQHVGSLLVKGCCVTRYIDKQRSFEIATSEKTYVLKTKLTHEADEWVEALAFAGARVMTSYCNVKDTSNAIRRLTMSDKRASKAERKASKEDLNSERRRSNDKGREEREKWFKKKHHRNRSISDTEVTLALRMAKQREAPTQHPKVAERDLERGTEQHSVLDSPVHIQENFVQSHMATPSVTVSTAPLLSAMSEPTIASPAFAFNAGYMANIPQGVAPVFGAPGDSQSGCCSDSSAGMQVPVMQHTSVPVLRCMGDGSSVVGNQFLVHQEL